MNEASSINSLLSQPQTSMGSNLSSVGSESNLEQFVSPHYLTWNRASRSNSWSDPVPTADDAASSVGANQRRGDSREAGENRARFAINWCELLDPDQEELHESLKIIYANILMNWGLLTGQKKTGSQKMTYSD